MTLSIYNSTLNFDQTLSECLELFKFRNSVRRQSSSCSIILLSGNKSPTASKQLLLDTVTKLFEALLLQPTLSTPIETLKKMIVLTVYVQHFIQTDSALSQMVEAKYLSNWLFTHPNVTRFTQRAWGCHFQTSPEIQRVLVQPTLSHSENSTLLRALTLFVHTQKCLIYVRDTLELCKRRETLRKNYLEEKFLYVDNATSRFSYVLNVEDISDIEDARLFLYMAKMRQLGFPQKERKQVWYPHFQKITKSTRSQAIKERCYKALDFMDTVARYQQTLNASSIEHFTDIFQKYCSPESTQGSQDEIVGKLEMIAHLATKAFYVQATYLNWQDEEIATNLQDPVEKYLLPTAEKIALFSQAFQATITKYFAIGTVKELYQQIFQKATSTKEFPKNKLLSPEEFAKEADLLAAPLPPTPSITKTLIQEEEEDVARLAQAMKDFNIQDSTISETPKQRVAPKKAKTKQATQKTATSSGYAYHKRVTRWWSNDPSTDPFLNDPQYIQCQPETQKRIRSEHAFALAVDKYVESEGIGNKEGQKTLIGEMTMHDGQKRRGVFGYVFDKNKTCYHRHFTEKVVAELYGQLLEQGFYQLDFPPLTSQEKKQTVNKTVAHDGSHVELETEEIVVIKNPSDNTTIRLCRFS